MSKTKENLAEAFAGESQANRKYLAFSKKAEEEGYEQVAKLFRAAADAETVHALNHLERMDLVKSTKENLEAAVSGETEEFEKMYPEMIETAKEEDEKAACMSFMWANAVEKEHAALYKKALDNIENPEAVEYWVCQACGHTHEGEPENVCPVCGAGKEAFKKID
jgi:rubrerythrin